MAGEISSLKDFFVSIGIRLDKDAGNRAATDHAAVEEKITKTNEAAAAKRVKIEKDEQDKREGARKDAAKKEQERQEKAFKGLQTFATRAAAIATKSFVAIEASALGVVAAVDRAARSFESLNYKSKMSGSTPGGVSAFGYAASQLGASKEAAEAQLSTFGQKLKTNAAGYEKRLREMHIQTRNANGSMRETYEIATDIGEWMRTQEKHGGKYGYARALMQGRMFGFDGDPAQAMMRDGFRGFENQYKADQKKMGADPNAAAQSGTEFEQSMRHLNEVLGQIETKVTGELFKELKPKLDELSKWFDQHGDKVADIIARIAKDLTALGGAIAEKIAGADWDKILDNVEAMAEKFDGVAKRLTGKDGLTALFAAFGTVLALQVLAPLTKIVAGLGGIAGIRMPPWLLGLMGLGAATAYVGTAPYNDPEAQKGTGMVGLRKHQADRDEDAGGPLGSVKRAWKWATGGWGGGGGGAARIGKLAQNENAKAAIDELRKAGYNDNAIAAVIGSMQTESSFNPRAHNGIKGGHTGAWQWDSTRWPKIEAWIRGQGGDPADYRWQVKAWIAEHNAKPGDPIYDTSRTESGGRILRGNPTLPEAIHGVRESERFGPGEEGGRAANAANWLPHVKAPPPPPPAPPVAAKPSAPAGGGAAGGIIGMRKSHADAPNPFGALVPVNPGAPGAGPNRLKSGGYMSLGLGPDGRPARPLGDTPALHSSIDNSTTKGDTVINHTQNLHVSGGDVKQNLEATRMSASRGHADLLRNVKGAVA